MRYTKEYTTEISFPLGGIGSGSIGLAGNGRLIDWEIFNRPSKGSINGYSHFAINAIKDGKPVTYVLNGDLTKDLSGQYGRNFGQGAPSQTMCGFPHFKNVEFDGEFPFATLRFSDDDFPADVKMTAFNPFIPGDEDNSSIPAAFFEIEVNNTTDTEIEYRIALSVANPYEESLNKVEEINGRRILKLVNAGADKSDIKYGDLSAATDCADASVQTYWYRSSSWQDNIVTFWNNINNTEKLKDRKYDTPGKLDTGTIAATLNIAPGESKKARFVLSWNVPNNYNYWNEYKDTDGKDIGWKNYYAVLFKDSAESASYALNNWDNLYNRTLKFKNILHSSTLPQSIIDAAASNLSVLKSATVLRLEDGSFYGWEGCNEKDGSCEGTCQHVWNYAYAMCYLFPRLERSIRDLEFKYSTDADGKTAFRLSLPAGREMNSFRACLDGQMGVVIKFYREWKLSGDNEWLKNNWETIKKVLEYAWSDKNPDKWDFNKDGVLEGRQHHTLDMELFGPSSWLEGMYLAALKAASEMADFLDDKEKADEYAALFEKGKKWTKENLFNGKYFIHKIDVGDKSVIDTFGEDKTFFDPDTFSYWNDETKEIKYQIADGSSIDQLLAQWHADIIGLGDIFDSAQTDAALDFMMKNNYKESMRGFANPWRIYSLNDESGSVICVYPEGCKKPTIPIPYTEETMTGFEYSFAGLLCSRGRIDDGTTVTKAVRNRFNGKSRNPYNEIECGSNYARSMASYAMIPILSGFVADLPHNRIAFNPYKTDEFNTIWSLDGAWGEFKIKDRTVYLKLCEGALDLSSFGASFCDGISDLKIDGKNTSFTFDNGIIAFDKTKVSDDLQFKF